MEEPEEIAVQVFRDLINKHEDVCSSAYKGLREGDDNYQDFRATIFATLKKVRSGWGAADQTITSYVCTNVIRHMANKYRDYLPDIEAKVPKWAADHHKHMQERIADFYGGQQKPSETQQQEVQPQNQENSMNIKATNPALAVETVSKTFIFGRDIDTLSDDDIFTIIANLENEIKTLDAIENKPVKLGKKIEALREDIANIKMVVDSRP